MKKTDMINEINRLFALQEEVEYQWEELTKKLVSNNNLTEEEKIQIKLIKHLRNIYQNGADS